MGSAGVSTTEDHHVVAGQLALQAISCDALGSAFYAALLREMAFDVEAGGPTWELLGPYADRPFDDVLTPAPWRHPPRRARQ
jgi:hypothetical protein